MMKELTEDIRAIALSGYLGILKTTKKDFDGYLQIAMKSNQMLDSFINGEEVNLRIIRNNVVILHNMFDPNTARTLLYYFSNESNAILINTILVYLSRSNDPNVDKTFLRRLENG